VRPQQRIRKQVRQARCLRLRMAVRAAVQPTSVRKFSHEEAENRKAAHEASGGNKVDPTEQPDPEDEEAIQVPPFVKSNRESDQEGSL
jgi:hypothetical protein